MRLLLRKSWTNEQGRKYAIGTVLQLFPSLGKKLIADKIAVEYNGEYPPKGKIKTNFFKPK